MCHHHLLPLLEKQSFAAAAFTNARKYTLQNTKSYLSWQNCINLAAKCANYDHKELCFPKLPVGFIQLQDNQEKWGTHLFWAKNFSVNYQLDPKLRLNLTFHHIYFSSFNNKKHCLRVVHFLSKPISYCGTFSWMQAFSAFNRIFVDVLHSPDHAKVVFFKTLFEYSAHDPHRVTTIGDRPYVADNKMRCCLFLHQHKSVVSRFHIRYHAFAYMVLVTRLKAAQHLRIHDGPGIKSPVLASLGPESVESRVRTRAFQCVVLFVQRHAVGQVKHWEGQQFAVPHQTGANMSTIQLSETSEALSSRVQFPSRTCSNDSVTCLLLVVVSGQSHLNISVTNLTYTGEENSATCAYAGVSFVELPHRNHTTCVRPSFGFVLNTQDKYRNIYSYKSSMWIAFYNYREYGNVTVHLSMSLTSCKPYVLDPCSTFRPLLHLVISLKYDPCYVMQVNNQNNSAFKTNIEPVFEEERSSDIVYTGFAHFGGTLAFHLYWRVAWCLGSSGV